MKSSNRFLLGFGIIITVLVIAAIILVVTNHDEIDMLPEDTPQGTVQRFLLAVQEHDIQKAYTYLNIVENDMKLTYDDWIQSNSNEFQATQTTWKATLGNTVITDDTALVEVLFDVFQSGSPFEDPILTRRYIYQLGRTNDTWFITERPWLYWLY